MDQASQAGDDQALLVTGDGPGSQVHAVTLQYENCLIVPFHWIFGRINGASLLTSKLEIWKIRKLKFKGLAGPASVGVSFFSGYYLFLMVFGIFTLSIPVRVDIGVESEKKSMQLDEIIDFLVKVVLKNPNFYTRRDAQNIVKNIKNERKFSRVAKFFE